jgi:hypothetical protein
VFSYRITLAIQLVAPKPEWVDLKLCRSTIIIYTRCIVKFKLVCLRMDQTTRFISLDYQFFASLFIQSNPCHPTGGTQTKMGGPETFKEDYNTLDQVTRCISKFKVICLSLDQTTRFISLDFNLFASIFIRGNLCHPTGGTQTRMGGPEILRRTIIT